jgi:general secretion pathway protein F
MPNFRYRALTESGELVNGLISAPTAAEVTRRIEYLRLVPIDTVLAGDTPKAWSSRFSLVARARPEDVTIFTRDLALLLQAGARLDEALELLATDADISRMRPVVNRIRSSILSGESFADALSHHDALFSAIYIALVRVGEASGKLERILDTLASERARAEALRRKLADALRYPAFLLFAAACVLIFFLTFVMPQFGGVLRDFGANVGPVAKFFLGLSEFMTAHEQMLALLTALVMTLAFFLLRRPGVRATVLSTLSRLPLVGLALIYHRTALFCRNLGVLLSAGVSLTTALRILTEMMATTGDSAAWTQAVEHVRHGRKLSDALSDTTALPAMAVRMLRLGEETGQLPALAIRIAEFYEAKLQRGLDRVVGIIGPAAIMAISVIVGGLIVSVMTSLLSVSQVVG